MNLPFFKLSTEPSDSASVKIEHVGHYCISFVEKPDVKADLLPIVYDTSKVFGIDTTLLNPYGFRESSVKEILAKDQYGWAKTSSAFAAASQITLKPGEHVTITSVYGKADRIDELPNLSSIVTAPNFISTKFERARTMINELTSSVETKTVNPLFDGTVRQM